MAKKTKRKITKITFDKNLPQNILPVGERVEEDKKIYISQAAYKEIHEFTRNKTTNESGGMLIGNVIEEFGKINIVIQGFVEAKYAEGTPTTLKFTHETWDYVHEEIDRKYENGQIVGWIHTHPDFGIFLSEYDKFIQENFFKEDYQIAYVVDPIQHIEGFYFWINGKIERCKGFFVFDKMGEKINLNDEKDKRSSCVSGMNLGIQKGISMPGLLLCSGLIVAVIVLAILSMNLMNRMQILETQQENLVESANQSINYLQQQIASLSDEIENLQSQVDELKPKEENIENTENTELDEENESNGSKDSQTDEQEVDSVDDKPVSEEETENE